MARWSLVLQPTPADVPRFAQLAQAVADDIRRGRLLPGQRLPGSRALALQLGVHRNTVLAGLAELVAEGWLSTTPGSGTFVSARLPEAQAQRPRRQGLGRLGVALPPLDLARREPQDRPGVLALSGGSPDPRLVPVEALSRAWRRVVRRQGHRLLEYGPPAGHQGLRVALAELVRTLRGVPAGAEEVLVTRGSQMAIDLCARALLAPGDVVAVEALGYRPAWDALRLSGARLAPVPVDAEGLDVEALAALGRRQPIRALYVTPHHQYPTTATMSAARRLRLLSLARERRFLILEDDYDHEFHYDGRPVLPLASADDAGLTVYIGTLSKVLAPGLRLGFVVAPVELVDRLVRLRGVMDRQGDLPMEAAVAELLEEGALQRHVRKMRTAYLDRRDALVEALRAGLGEAFDLEVPRGGISLWLRCREPRRFEPWLARCAAAGVLLAPGSRYTFDGGALAATRAVFSRYAVPELRRAARVMRGAWRVTSASLAR
jgi:GntR family transcriptional regulator / MocR family aminotransferase